MREHIIEMGDKIGISAGVDADTEATSTERSFHIQLQVLSTFLGHELNKIVRHCEAGEGL